MSKFVSSSSSDMLPVLGADPGAAVRRHRAELDAALSTFLESGNYILGAEVAAFEAEFAAYQGVHGAIGTANGTDALELCLRACGITDGQLVALPTHTAVATAAAVRRAGAIPVLVDIDPGTFNLDPGRLEEALDHPDFGKHIKAIIAVHLYGCPCDMAPLMVLSQKRGLTLIEDCSQAHGASWHGAKVGTFGAAAAFSCYPTKNLGALGDAGICTARDPKVLERVRSLRQYGWKTRYISEETGMNSRLDEMQAAILRVRLRHLDEENQRRQRYASLYGKGFAGLPIKLPQVPATGEAEHVYHQFTIRVPEKARDPLLEHLRTGRMFASILYPSPVHQQPAYADVAAQFPLDRGAAETVCRELLCLPVHPFLSEGQIATVCGAIQRFPW